MSNEKTPSPYAKHFPLFSIITVTLNNYDGLIKTYKSLEKQSFEDYEWLVIDGGSTDDTVEFLRKRRSATRTALNPFRFTSEPDQGIYDAMNKGIESAKGHYLLFLNAGDALATENILAKLTPICEKKPDFIYGHAYEQAQNGRKPVAKSASSHTETNWGMFTHHQAMIYRRHLVRNTRLRYSLRYKIASDYDFTVRFLKECQNVQHLPHPICIFELGGISQQQAWLGRKEQYMIREELEIAPLPMNLWILFVQTISWHLKAISPWLYNFLKTAEKQLTSTHHPKQ